MQTLEPSARFATPGFEVPVFPWSTALVTGASAGIGEAIAELLSASGVHTVVVARRSERLQAIAQRLPHIEVLTADLLDDRDRQRVLDRLQSHAEPIELLVNNAGFGADGTVASVPTDKALGMIDLNVRALTELTKAALDVMIPAKHGWILQVSSVASFQPGPSAAIYSATKAYVTSFTEALHEELRGTGVQVSALCPGFTHTEFHEVSGSDPAGIPSFAWLDAGAVAEAGLKALAAGRAMSVPGPLYKGIGVATRLLPRSLVRRAIGAGARKR